MPLAKSRITAALMSLLLCFALVPAGVLAAVSATPDAAYADTSTGTKAKTYKVKYVLNGGKNAKANKTSYTGKLTLKSPTRKGYSFKGWYTDKKCTKRIKTVSGKSVTVYAKWAKKKSSSSSGSGGSQTVYLSQTGTKYHLKSCRTLKKSPIKTTRAEAESQGYTACKVCKP